MPAFQWFDGVIAHNFSSDVTCPGQMAWNLIRNLTTALYYNPSDHPLILRMYSSLENRWLDVMTFEYVRQEWPYIQPESLVKVHEELFYIIEAHSYFYATNPCSEIPLGESQGLSNLGG